MMPAKDVCEAKGYETLRVVRKAARRVVNVLKIVCNLEGRPLTDKELNSSFTRSYEWMLSSSPQSSAQSPAGMNNFNTCGCADEGEYLGISGRKKMPVTALQEHILKVF